LTSLPVINSGAAIRESGYQLFELLEKD